MSKIALVFPRCKYPTGDIPLGVIYIASELSKLNGIHIDIIDTTFIKNPKNHIYHHFKNNEYDLVGFSVMTSMLKDAFEMSAIIKVNNPDLKIIFGGPHPTVAPELTLENENIDAVCIGEGEKTMRDLVEAGIRFEGIEGIWYKQDGNIIKNPQRKVINNLDELDFPLRDLLDMNRYLKEWFQIDSVSASLKGTNLIASRGCPYKCTYCQPTLSTIFGKKIRKRTPENIVEELIFLKDRYKIEGFMFQDDTLIIDKKWILNICNEIIKNKINMVWGCNIRANLVNRELFLKMKEAGLRKVLMGIESTSQRILDDIYNKGINVKQVNEAVDILRKLDLKIQGYFMIGAPTETEAEIINTIKYAKNLDIDDATFSITTPLPYTYLYDKSKDLIKQGFEEFDYYKRPVYEGDTIIPPSKLVFLKRRAFVEFYLSKKRIFKTMKALLSPKTYKKLKRF